MNLTKRADKDALAPVRARWSTKFLTGVAALAAVLTCFDGPLPAMMTRTNRVHARPVAQEAEPTPKTKTKTPTAKAGKAAKAGTPAAQTAKKPAAPAAKAKARGKKQKPEPEDVDDSITMKRAGRGREPLKAKPSGREVAIARNRAPLPMPDPEPRKTHVVAVAARVSKPAEAKPVVAKPAPSEAPRTLAASDDFLAAAGKHADAAPDKEALAQGVSHPDEMDDEQPLTPVVAKPAKPAAHQPVAQVSAAPPVETASSATRVAGFGAEGAPLDATAHRTLARTMAEHRAELAAEAKAGPLPAAEQAEITEEVVKPMVLPAVYTRGGRILMPAPLKGSHDVLVHQNTMADSEGLERIQDDDQLESLLASHQLARLPESASLHVNEDLPENRRYARPWTVHFAVDLAKAYQQHFGEPLQVNSAVRTVSYQLRLMRVNGNAAAVEGETASPHLTGQAIDFAKRNMSKAELAWMRAALLPLMQAGKIDVEEEFQQACFHISVYRSYLPAVKKKPKTELAAVKRDEVQDAR